MKTKAAIVVQLLLIAAAIGTASLPVAIGGMVLMFLVWVLEARHRIYLDGELNHCIRCYQSYTKGIER